MPFGSYHLLFDTQFLTLLNMELFGEARAAQDIPIHLQYMVLIFDDRDVQTRESTLPLGRLVSARCLTDG